jgi:hypothetical protein
MADDSGKANLVTRLPATSITPSLAHSERVRDKTMEKGGPRKTNSADDHAHVGAGKADARQAETKHAKVEAPRASESKERPQAVKKSAEEEEEDEDEAAGGPAQRKGCISLISADDSVAWFVSHSFTIQSLL